MFGDNKRLKILLVILALTACGMSVWLKLKSSAVENMGTVFICEPVKTMADVEIEKAVDTGKANAEFLLAKSYVDKGINLSDGIKMLERQSEAGDSNASLYLGVLYKEGMKMRRDDDAAIRWFTKATEQGSISAFRYLFSLYEKSDYKTAISWMRKAAEKGDAHSQFWLGARLMGRLHQFDTRTYSGFTEAGKPIIKAADAQVRDCTEAEKWLLKAAENPDKAEFDFYQRRARNALGTFYAIECGDDIQKGLEWWRSAQQENPWIKNIEVAYKDESKHVGLMNYHKDRAEPLVGESFFWLREAANTDNAYKAEWEQDALDFRVKKIEKRPLLLKSPLRGSEAITDLSFRPLLLLPEGDLRNLEPALKGDAAAQYALSKALKRESLVYYKEAYFWTLLATDPHTVEFMQDWQRRISPYLSADDIADAKKRAQEVQAKL